MFAIYIYIYIVIKKFTKCTLWDYIYFQEIKLEMFAKFNTFVYRYIFFFFTKLQEIYKYHDTCDKAVV